MAEIVVKSTSDAKAVETVCIERAKFSLGANDDGGETFARTSRVLQFYVS